MPEKVRNKGKLTGSEVKIRRQLEKKAQDDYESHGYACIRAIPTVKIIKGRYISIQIDFFNVADLICFHKDTMRTVFVQVTSSFDENDLDTTRRHMNKILELYKLPYPFHLLHYFKFRGKWLYKRYILLEGKFVREESLQ